MANEKNVNVIENENTMADGEQVKDQNQNAPGNEKETSAKEPGKIKTFFTKHGGKIKTGLAAVGLVGVGIAADRLGLKIGGGKKSGDAPGDDAE